MAVLYRAIWSDADDESLNRARESFCAWARGKSEDLLVADNVGEELTEDGSFAFRLEHEQSEDPAAPVTVALQASLVEKRTNGTRWTTTLRTWTGPQCHAETAGAGVWIWVDVEAVTDDSLEGIVVGAPKFVRELLDVGKSPGRRGVPLAAIPVRYQGADGAESLAALLTNIDRDLPVVVFTQPPDWFDNRGLPTDRTVSEMYEGAMRCCQ